MRDHFVMLARYNAWANQRVYDAASTVSPEALDQDIGAAARSIIATLNHLLLVDRNWMAQLNDDGEAPDSVDAVLFDDLTELREARERDDARILAFVERLKDEDLARTVRYHTIRQPLVEELPHRGADLRIHPSRSSPRRAVGRADARRRDAAPLRLSVLQAGNQSGPPRAGGLTRSLPYATGGGSWRASGPRAGVPHGTPVIFLRPIIFFAPVVLFRRAASRRARTAPERRPAARRATPPPPLPHSRDGRAIG